MDNPVNQYSGCFKITGCLLLVTMMAAGPASSSAQEVSSPYDFPYGYPFREYPVNGASHPSWSNDYLDREPDPQRELKRVGQYALRLIQTDSAEKAIRYTDWYRAHYPHLLDGEMLFMRTVAQAQLGRVDEAMASMRLALEQPDLPPQRIIAGPRRLLAPLQNRELYRRLIREWKDKPVHGPMLGAMTGRSVKVWVRTAAETPVQVAVSRSADMSDSIVSDSYRSRSEDDYTVEIPVTGLESATKYFYEVWMGQNRNRIRSPDQVFRTYPERRQRGTIRVAFGGCAGIVPHNERVWDRIDRFNPHAFLTLGDNVYIDDPESPDQARYLYYQRQGRPEFRRMVAGSPVYAIWDDHDFGMDDSWGGPEADIPYWKPMVWEIFTQNWVNPEYASGDRPGGWYDFHIGDLHVIMLDTRYYREDAGRFAGEGVPNPSMLGPNQLAWLKKTLSGSDATFKLLVSSVPWHYDAKGDGTNRVDGWAGYRGERSEIFSWIDEYQLEGVLLLSSDRHRSDAWLTHREGGYDLYEFSSGQFTNQHTHPVLKGSLLGYNEKPSFGLLDVDTGAEDPTVTYRIVDIDGFIRDSLSVKLSQLRY